MSEDGRQGEPAPPKYLRRIIRITAEHSPNVILGLAQKARGLPDTGLQPNGEPVLVGVLSYEQYLYRRKVWSKQRQAVGLDAMFWEGENARLYPSDWIDRAWHLADLMRLKPRYPRWLGVDPAEGGDKTAMSAIDEWGLVRQWAEQTPDTNVIVKNVIGLINGYKINPRNVLFDRGGGGKEHADRLRAIGYDVRTVNFGDPVNPDPDKTLRSKRLDKELLEERSVYKDLRALMYDQLSQLMDPAANPNGFTIPAKYVELRRQMTPIPRLYDDRGRMFIPPKRKKNSDDRRVTLEGLIGHSPDELESLLLAVHARLNPTPRGRAGAVR